MSYYCTYRHLWEDYQLAGNLYVMSLDSGWRRSSDHHEVLWATRCTQGRPTIALSPPADVRECKIFLSTDVTMAATSTTPLRDMRKLRVAELREWLKAKEVAYLPRDTTRTMQQIATAYLKAHVTPIDRAKVDGMTDEEVSDALEVPRTARAASTRKPGDAAGATKKCCTRNPRG